MTVFRGGGLGWAGVAMTGRGPPTFSPRGTGQSGVGDSQAHGLDPPPQKQKVGVGLACPEHFWAPHPHGGWQGPFGGAFGGAFGGRSGGGLRGSFGEPFGGAFGGRLGSRSGDVRGAVTISRPVHFISFCKDMC